jgi:methionyl-tRNA synthetase
MTDKKKQLTWDDFGKTELLPAGHALGEVSLMFEKIEDEVIEVQIKKLQDTKTANALAEQADGKPLPKVKESVAFEDFEKLDIRVGTVLECEKVPKSDKLLRFKIEDGMGGRTILSGIAEHYPDPQELLGRQVCFVANFEPRKLRGLMSEGMILSAQDADGSYSLIYPSKKVKPGNQVV